MDTAPRADASNSLAHTLHSLLSCMRCIAQQPMSARHRLMHAVWLGVMRLAPRPLAAALVSLRFRRAELWQPLRRRASAWTARLRGQTAARAE